MTHGRSYVYVYITTIARPKRLLFYLFCLNNVILLQPGPKDNGPRFHVFPRDPGKVQSKDLKNWDRVTTADTYFLSIIS